MQLFVAICSPEKEREGPAILGMAEEVMASSSVEREPIRWLMAAVDGL